MSLLNTLKFIINHPVNRRNRLGALRNFLRWQIVSRLALSDIVYPWVNGTKFFVQRGENGLTGNIYVGLQEFEHMAFAFHFLRKEDLFVDIGANSGSYTVLACGAAGARGIAIEPVPGTFDRLTANVRLNHLGSRVKCLNVGVADKKGYLNFSSGNDAMNHVLIKSEKNGKSIKIKVNTLDRILKTKKPRLIKIDVEGYEFFAFKGAVNILECPSLDAIICEVNDFGNRYGIGSTQVSSFLKRYGFGMFTYNPETRKLNILNKHEKKGDNILFIRISKRVTFRLENSSALEFENIKI